MAWPESFLQPSGLSLEAQLAGVKVAFGSTKGTAGAAEKGVMEAPELGCRKGQGGGGQEGLCPGPLSELVWRRKMPPPHQS